MLRWELSLRYQKKLPEGLIFKMKELGNSLVFQWLGLGASIAGGTGSIPGGRTKIPHAVWHGQKKRKRKKELDLVSVTEVFFCFASLSSGCQNCAFSHVS